MLSVSTRVLSDNWFVTDSLQLAKSINKRHEQILKDITFLVNTEYEQMENFKASTYFSSPPVSRELPRFIITKKGYERLEKFYQNKAKKGFRKEHDFGYMLMDALSDKTEIISQFFVKPYRIDFYLPEFKMAIEYDEYYHQTNKQHYLDLCRERKIKEQVPDITIVRVKEGQELKGLNLIIKMIDGKEGMAI